MEAFNVLAYFNGCRTFVHLYDITCFHGCETFPDKSWNNLFVGQ